MILPGGGRPTSPLSANQGSLSPFHPTTHPLLAPQAAMPSSSAIHSEPEELSILQTPESPAHPPLVTVRIGITRVRSPTRWREMPSPKQQSLAEKTTHCLISVVGPIWFT